MPLDGTLSVAQNVLRYQEEVSPLTHTRADSRGYRKHTRDKYAHTHTSEFLSMTDAPELTAPL